MRAQPEGPPDTTHGGLTQARPRCQRATAPMRGSLGSLFQGEAYGPLDTVIADLPWRSRPHLVAQTNYPLGDKTIPPHPHGEPVVRSLAATAALLSPLAHSRTMRARKASDRELRGCCSNCRKVIFCSGLTTSSRFLGRPRGFDMIHDNPSSLFMQSIYDSLD